jgi:hypothetical protein
MTRMIIEHTSRLALTGNIGVVGQRARPVAFPEATRPICRETVVEPDGDE